MPEIKVYIWDFQSTEVVGHSSMSLSNGTYISWWPQAPIKSNIKHVSAPVIQNRKLEDDIEAEPDNPKVYTLNISDQQQAKITEWWKKFSAKNKEYHLWKTNCSTVVYLALCEAFPQLQALSGVTFWFPYAIELIVGEKGLLKTGSVDKVNFTKQYKSKISTLDLGEIGQFVTQ